MHHCFIFWTLKIHIVIWLAIEDYSRSLCYISLGYVDHIALIPAAREVFLLLRYRSEESGASHSASVETAIVGQIESRFSMMCLDVDQVLTELWLLFLVSSYIEST